MNFLQIWIGNKPTNRIKYMESVLSKLKNTDEYILVSKSNYFKDNKKVIWKNISTIIKELFVDYPLVEKYWDKMFVELQSDMIRFYLASKIKDLVYLDNDVNLKKYPVFENNGIPCFSKYNIAKYDICFFYNNNNFEWFKRLLESIMCLIDFNNRELDNRMYDISFRCMQVFKNNNGINEINNDFYDHLRLHKV